MRLRAPHVAVAPPRPAPTLILGLGNILLRDEGLGVRVVEAMEKLDLPAGVELFDGATYGIDLVNVLAQRDRVIVIDAIDADCEPGTMMRLTADELAPAHDRGVSLHELGLCETLTVAQRMGCAPREVTIIGVAPADLRPGLELSPTIQRVMPRIIEAVRAELDTRHAQEGEGQS